MSEIEVDDFEMHLIARGLCSDLAARMAQKYDGWSALNEHAK